MKKILVLFLIISGVYASSIAQGEPLRYEGVVYVSDSANSQVLFNRCKNWFVETYSNYDEIKHNEDSSNGLIYTKPLMRYDSNVFSGHDMIDGYISYNFSVYFKNGRYKYVVDNVFHEGNTFAKYRKVSFGFLTTDREFPHKIPVIQPKKWKNKVWSDINNQFDTHISSLLKSLERSMSIPLETKTDEW